MHEVGIAASIIEIAEGAAHNTPILKIHLKLGAFTGVVREALEFAFEALREGTLAAGAQLEIETVPLIVTCAACQRSGPPVEDYCLVCPSCGAPAEIVSGREMHVEYIDLDDSLKQSVIGDCACRATKGSVSPQRAMTSCLEAREDGTRCGRNQGSEQERGVRAGEPATV